MCFTVRSHSPACVGLSLLTNVLFVLGTGFLARTLCGPRLDPQAYFVLFVMRPIFVDRLNLLSNTFHPGPPKRLAQFMGLMFMYDPASLCTPARRVTFVFLCSLSATLFRFAIFPDSPTTAYWILAAQVC